MDVGAARARFLSICEGFRRSGGVYSGRIERKCALDATDHGGRGCYFDDSLRIDEFGWAGMGAILDTDASVFTGVVGDKETFSLLIVINMYCWYSKCTV